MTYRCVRDTYAAVREHSPKGEFRIIPSGLGFRSFGHLIARAPSSYHQNSRSSGCSRVSSSTGSRISGESASPRPELCLISSTRSIVPPQVILLCKVRALHTHLRDCRLVSSSIRAQSSRSTTFPQYTSSCAPQRRSAPSSKSTSFICSRTASLGRDTVCPHSHVPRSYTSHAETLPVQA